MDDEDDDNGEMGRGINTGVEVWIENASTVQINSVPFKPIHTTLITSKLFEIETSFLQALDSLLYIILLHLR